MENDGHLDRRVGLLTFWKKNGKNQTSGGFLKIRQSALLKLHQHKLGADADAGPSSFLQQYRSALLKYLRREALQLPDCPFSSAAGIHLVRLEHCTLPPLFFVVHLFVLLAAVS